ncbi:MAG: hypothetical protein A2591_04170 [Candidatus Yonathbacteria bacterium RIFOXYD1_FULL_52_36]|uniref:Thymidylate synthase/dCMP hydroxymethylase domain-containing protein n=1 Tax=Candidatus Yonathbacteria bacterium RIFOXYD1_FULL_52_36 TaxID=1802730 RepID=A0A1G2SHM2_9BACT|nr:MAG: hypothetical protein A2591_04170 [Candidatus Yonathbacteria bacterium RIFOXYD1_FULL_52_36]
MLERTLNHPDDVQVLPFHENSETRSIYGHLLRFPMENGVPIITERDISKLVHGAIGEMLSFRDGVRTYQEMSEKYGCKFWKKWVTKEQCAKFDLPEGDLGDGSYGPAWTQPVITPDGTQITQIEALLNQMRDYPRSLTHRLNNWMPDKVLQWEGRKRNVVVAPCHGDVSFFLNPDTKCLNVHHDQRAADEGSGLPFNFIHYTALGMMVAQVLGYTFKELVYTIRHGEIYQVQYESIRELLTRESRRFPTLHLDPSVKDFFEFRPEHFTLEDYDPHPAMRIPTPL